MKFDYFYGKQAEQYDYLYIPKALMKKELYAKMSAAAKILYAVLMEKQQQSVEQGWIDENNYVFIVTLVKDDGTEINVTSDAKIEKAEESTGEGTSDIAVSEDVRKEVETTKQEEKEITDAREEISNIENDVSNNDVPSENQSSDTSDANNSDNTENNISSDNGNGSSDNNTDNNIGNADSSDNPTPTPTPEPEPEPVVKTMVNPIDGKIYTYIEPDEMLAKYVKNDTEVYDLNRDVNFGGGTLPYAIKEMTTRPFFYKDGTYSIFYGYYSKSGDIMATPLQMGYDPGIRFEVIAVGRYDNGINVREYAFHYLKKYIDI